MALNVSFPVPLAATKAASSGVGPRTRQVCVDEASAECVLGAVERAPPMNRQAWVEGVAACRRRSPLALTWNKTPLRRALMTKNRLALLSVRAAVTGVKRHLAARGLGAADAFRSLDCSSRGVLTVDEMTHGWRRLGLQFTPAQSAELVDYMREPGAELDAGVTLRRWREIFGGQSESATSLDIAEVALSQGQLLASSAQADWQLTHPAEPLVSSAVGVEPRSAASGPVQVSSKVSVHSHTLVVPLHHGPAMCSSVKDPDAVSRTSSVRA